MELFIGFILVCFVGGLLLRRLRPRQRARLLFILCLFLAFAYYFLNQL